MNTRLLTGGIALLTWTVVASAQAQTATQNPRAKEPAAKTTTLQGCLERSPGAGMAGASGTSSTDSSFLLISTATPFDSRRAATDGAQTPGPGALGSGSMAGMQTAYRLESDAGTLTPHVGHKVEIVGVIDQRAASNSAGNNSGAPMPAPSMNAPTLKVQSVKTIAASCMGS